MTDRPSMPQETVATRAAFRAGVKGLRYTENPDPDFASPSRPTTRPDRTRDTSRPSSACQVFPIPRRPTRPGERCA
jgi:hypothetical protein